MTTQPLAPCSHNNPVGDVDLPAQLAKGRRLAAAIGRSLAANTGYSDDVIAEAELGLVESLERFRGGKGATLTTFAYPRMRGRALRAVRRERRARALAIQHHELAKPPNNTAPIRQHAAVQQLLRNVAGHLDRHQQSILNKHYCEGMSFAAIARRHRWSHSSTVRRHQQLIAQLRAHAHGEAPQAPVIEENHQAPTRPKRPSRSKKRT